MNESIVSTPSAEEYHQAQDEFVSHEQEFQKYLADIKKSFSDLTDREVEFAVEVVMKAMFAGLTIAKAVPVELVTNKHNTKLTIGYVSIPNSDIGGIATATFLVDGVSYYGMENLPSEYLAKALITEVFAVINVNRVAKRILKIRELREISQRTLSTHEEMTEAEKEAYLNEEDEQRRRELIKETELDMAHEIGHTLEHIQSGNNFKRMVDWKNHISTAKQANPEHIEEVMTEEDFTHYKNTKSEKRANFWMDWFHRKYPN